MKRHYMIISTVCLLIISVFYVSYRTYADKGRRYYEETGQVVWDINTDERIVALTFDDGPHRKYTTEVLDLLVKYDAKATFFILGENAEKNPELVLREYDEGHELANHTYTRRKHPFQI